MKRLRLRQCLMNFRLGRTIFTTLRICPAPFQSSDLRICLIQEAHNCSQTLASTMRTMALHSVRQRMRRCHSEVATTNLSNFLPSHRTYA